MKNSISKKLSLALASAAFGLAVSFSAMAAAPTGTLEGADNSSVYGWVWDSDSYGHVIPVEISVYPVDSSEVLKTATVKADYYQEKLQESIGDGYHGFKYSVDWNQFDKEDFRVTAYAVTETERVFLGELTYNKVSDHFVLGADASQETSSEAPASQDTPKSVSSDQGPGVTSVSTQAPGQVSAFSRTMNGAAVSTQAPGQASASSQTMNGTAVSTQAPGQASASLQTLSGTAVSAQAPKQASVSLQAASENSVSAQTSGSGNGAETQASAYTASPESSDKSSGVTLLSWQKGPGAVPKKDTSLEKVPVSLGMFTVTGYCGCEICCPSSTSNLTYSGTEPQPEHTISADINVFPIGTRLMINGIVYTVEDIGSNVTENRIDIFYATHEEALAHGTTTEEVFAVDE